MNTFEKVLSITEKGTNKKALDYNGLMFEDAKGHKGIFFGYVVEEDYWVYWYEDRVLAHHEQQASILHARKKGYKNGCDQYYVNEQEHEQLWAMRKENAPVVPDYSMLDVRQLSGFIHCMELDLRGEPKQELYINMKDIYSVVPAKDEENVYTVSTKNNWFRAYIPEHQFS